MGMFDKPQYLTGKGDSGYVSEGDTFWIHRAKLDGTTTIGGTERPQARLQVSHTRDGDRADVWTSGAGITGQVARMDATDRAAFPIEVRLDAIPATRAGYSATFVLTPADMPEPSAVGTDDDGGDIGW